MNIRRFIPARDLALGYEIPHGWGRAYSDPCRDYTIIAPIPLNWIIGWTRIVYYNLMRGPRTELESKAYRRGFEHGMKVGEDVGVRLQQQTLQTALDMFFAEKPPLGRP